MSAEPVPLRPGLSEVTLSPTVYKSSAFVDIVSSAERKHNEPEVSWVNQTNYVYATVEDSVTEFIDEAWIKYLGDGFLIVAENPEGLLNACIRIQEVLDDARGNRQAAGVARINFTVSIGVTSGYVYEFTRRDGRNDYLGLSLDRAARLCGAASPNAIFVDSTTVSDSSMRLVNSSVGKVLHYDSNEYVGAVQKAPLRGFPEPVEYHELRWGRELFGARSQVVTEAVGLLKDSSAGTRTPSGGSSAASAQGRGIQRGLGSVTSWDAERKFGFVSDDTTGEDYHFKPSLFVYEDDLPTLRAGMRIAFAPMPPQREGQHGSAAAILVVGRDAEGTVVSLPEGRDYGWIRCNDRAGNSQMVWFSTKDAPAVEKGTQVSFTVAERSGKACATDLEVEDD